MTIPVFVGDEVTASAWRLIGVRTIVVQGDAVAGILDTRLEDTALLLITTACAARLDGEQFAAVLRRARPLVLVVPDAANRLALPDLDREVDRVLGIEQ